jgi:hypothetical protein
MRKLTAAAVTPAAALMIGAGVAKADPAQYYDRATRIYLSKLRNDADVPELARFTDGWLISEGHEACYSLQLGWTHEQVWAGIRADAHLPYNTVADAAITGPAVGTWCPEYRLTPNTDPSVPQGGGQTT